MYVSVVTSCSKQGWEQYGRRFIDTFHRFWSHEVPLHFVSEDDLSLPVSITGSQRKVRLWDLRQHKPYALFQGRHKDNPAAHGRGAQHLGNAKLNKRDRGYSYRHDAARFSKKVFAIEMLLPTINQGRLIWLDADTVTLAPVPSTLFETIHPANYCVAYLDRSPYHSECGFVSYNLMQARTQDFIKSFANLYASDEVFKLAEWHDSWVFDWLRKKMSISSYQIPHKGNVTHPFVHSELGKYMDHLKGARKQHGVSKDHPRFSRGGRGVRRSGPVRIVPRPRPPRPPHLPSFGRRPPRP